MPTLSLAIAPDINEYFQEAVSDAMRVHHVEATASAASYLVSLLCAYAHPDERQGEAFDRPLTLLLHEAVLSADPQRFQRLRAIGDHALYAVGFFGEHIDQKGLDRAYVSNVGASAYSHAAAALRLRTSSNPPNVLSELSAKFVRFAEVLQDVAEGTLASGAGDERSVVRLYERWLRSGSSRLAEELGARGILPSRRSGAVH